MCATGYKNLQSLSTVQCRFFFSAPLLTDQQLASAAPRSWDEVVGAESRFDCQNGGHLGLKVNQGEQSVNGTRQTCDEVKHMQTKACRDQKSFSSAAGVLVTCRHNKVGSSVCAHYPVILVLLGMQQMLMFLASCSTCTHCKPAGGSKSNVFPQDPRTCGEISADPVVRIRRNLSGQMR